MKTQGERQPMGEDVEIELGAVADDGRALPWKSFLDIQISQKSKHFHCRRGDSNPYAFRHWLLRPARLPIPPLLLVFCRCNTSTITREVSGEVN